MNEMIISALTAGVAVLIVKIGEIAIAALKARHEAIDAAAKISQESKKDDAKLDIADRTDIINQYRLIITDLQKSVLGSQVEAKELHTLYLESKVQAAETRVRVADLEKENARLIALIDSLKDMPHKMAENINRLADLEQENKTLKARITDIDKTLKPILN